jgi:serine/threonine protein kinase
MYFDKKEMKFKPAPKKIKNVSKEEGVSKITGEENGMNSSLLNRSKLDSVADISRSNALVGTAEYASPEMLSNSVTNHVTTDIWALGCIIYKFFHGKTPFKGGNEIMIFDNVLNMRYSIKQDVPEIVQDLIKRMLVEAPEKRLGAGEKGGEYDLAALKSHEFFRGVNFSNLSELTPPVKINPFPRLDKTKSTGDLNSIICLKSLSSDVDDLNISTGLLSCNSPQIKFKKCQSTMINNNPSISEFSYESFTELQEHHFIEDYVFKLEERRDSPDRLKKDILLLEEAIMRKREFLLVYTTRKVKLFSNNKIELWDLERNALMVKLFF